MIASLHLEGHSIASIQRLLASWGQPRSYNTIKSFLDRWTTRGGDYSNDKATGRPKKLNREQREMIKEEVRKRGGIRVGSGGIHAAADMAGVSWEELRDELAPGVSTRTLKRVVKGDYDSDEGEKEQEKEENGESGKKGKKPTVKKRKIGTQLEYKLVIPEEQSTEDVMSETMVQEEWLEAPGEPSPAKRRKVVDSEEVQQDHEDYVGSEWDGIGGDHNVSQGGLDVQSIEMIMAIQRDMGGMSSAAINPHSS